MFPLYKTSCPTITCYQNTTHSYAPPSFWRTKQRITQGKAHLNHPSLKESRSNRGRNATSVAQRDRLVQIGLCCIMWLKITVDSSVLHPQQIPQNFIKILLPEKRSTINILYCLAFYSSRAVIVFKWWQVGLLLGLLVIKPTLPGKAVYSFLYHWNLWCYLFRCPLSPPSLPLLTRSSAFWENREKPSGGNTRWLCHDSALEIVNPQTHNWNAPLSSWDFSSLICLGPQSRGIYPRMCIPTCIWITATFP